MTRHFVAALLVAADGTVKASVNPRTAGTEAQRLADDELLAEVAVAMREVPGEDKARGAGAEAWRIHRQQQGGGS